MTEREIWRYENDRCHCCHVPSHKTFMIGLCDHHIILRSRRRCDDPYNLLRLCGLCHMAAHGQRPVPADSDEPAPDLTFANCLWLKQHEDPTLWHPEALEVLYGQPLPEPERPVEYFFKQRRKSTPLMTIEEILGEQDIQR